MKNIPALNNSGATAVEFALILPVLLLVIFGIIEFSVVLYNKAIVTDASREGARSAVLYRPEWAPEANIEQSIYNHLQGRLINFGNSSPDFPVIQPDQENPEQFLVFNVKYDHSFLILPGSKLALTARPRMRIEK